MIADFPGMHHYLFSASDSPKQSLTNFPPSGLTEVPVEVARMRIVLCPPRVFSGKRPSQNESFVSSELNIFPPLFFMSQFFSRISICAATMTDQNTCLLHSRAPQVLHQAIAPENTDKQAILVETSKQMTKKSRRSWKKPEASLHNFY